MNERIKALADKARFVDSKETYPDQDVIFQKFAELIIRECIKTIEEVPNGYNDYRNQIENAMRNDCIKAIKTLFKIK